MKAFLGLGLAAAALLALVTLSAAGFECALGEKVSASLGDGVTLHSCSWEQTPGVFVRTGPLELVRSGILILKLQTDNAGRLQGEYSAWDDDGVLTETGHYRDGLKEGEWRSVDANGITRVEIFRAGGLVNP